MRNKKELLTRIISRNSNPYGDKLIEFMDEYGLGSLQEASEEQLQQYVEKMKGVIEYGIKPDSEI